MPEHKDTTEPNNHEPKGASTAAANEVYVADGLGSGSWENLLPMGGWRYSNIGTGTSFGTPSSYTLMNVVGVTTGLKDFTNNSLGRLTYTGTEVRHTHAVCDLSFKHSTGGGNDVYFAAYKNGAIMSSGSVDAEIVSTADSANYQHVAIHFDGMISTNDYFEIFLKTSSGNIIVHNAYLFIMGMPS